jgi:hypothetical protein
MKIRRSFTFAVASAVVLFGSLFLSLSTPKWCGIAVLSLTCVLAGVSLYFNAQERKVGGKRSVGLIAFAWLVIVFALLGFVPNFLSIFL